MVLTIDVGNSNIVLGGYQNDKICFLARIATNRHLEADQYALELRGILELYGVEQKSIKGIAISSVVPVVTPLLVQALAHFTNAKPLVLCLANAGNLRIDIEQPEELGMDLLASALATYHSYPLPAAIIDMGTATKITALDADGVLRGVSIAPGLFVSLEALVGGASLLKGIALNAPNTPAAIGRNTAKSMQSGLLLGTADMLDGLLDRFAAEMGPLATIVATGGGAPLVIAHCRHKIDFVDTLLLDGLYWAYRQNKGE
ncbi:type III pantothenate kinase [Ruminococcaceae bacterium OttesenSCG-928-A16]|nr:type III pantothenate kinase [Ruminococcaceae bacterium OttesenSCG-928-A16]